MSNYPRDEFDAVEENSARHGVHRSSMEAQGRSLMPLMIVGVAALCVGLLAFFIMPKILGNTTPPPLVANQTTAAPTLVPTAPATTAPAPTDSATTKPTETPTSTPTAEATPESVVDKSVTVAIFNATGVPGLAARYAGTVQGDGWVVSQSSNWGGQPQNTSVIFYSGLEQKANAVALGGLLNITELVDTAELGLPLAVVLGPGA